LSKYDEAADATRALAAAGFFIITRIEGTAYTEALFVLRKTGFSSRLIVARAPNFKADQIFRPNLSRAAAGQ